MVRVPLQVCLSVAVAGCCGLLTAPGANAGNGAPGGRFGNGRFNHNSFIINSPSWSHDLQHIRNVNVGGNTVTPAALCKNHIRRCKIVQRMNVWDP
jgi:hypothetical protein